MAREKLGKSLISFVLVASAVVSVAVDWNTSHVFSPEWHPHAKFHDVLLLSFLSSVTVLALWLMWRRSLEPAVGVAVAALIPVMFWAPFYVITWLVPEASLNAHLHEGVPHAGGVPIYPNIVVATVSLALNALGYGLYRSARRPASPAA